MDELLDESLLEATAHVGAASSESPRFENEPAYPALSARIFRHIPTIKGGGGFLSLPRVGRFVHASERLMGLMRAGAVATPCHVFRPCVADFLSANPFE